MPSGSNLTTDHQRNAARQPRPPRQPKTPASAKALSGETMEAALLRFQQAKADTESLDAEKRAIDVAKARGDLIPAEDARDEIEATHLAWVAQLDQLPQAVASALPPEIPASTAEVVRAAVEAACLAMRRQMAANP